MLSTEVCFNPSVYLSIIHTTLWSLPLMNSRSIFTSPCPTLALASNIYTLLISSPSPQVPFFSIMYHYQMRHNSPHSHAIFFPYIVFECRHSIRNQLVSTEIPSPNSFIDITTIETHQHFGKILKDIFVDFSSGQYGTSTNKTHRQTLLALIFIFIHIHKFFLFIINPRILSFSQIVLSLHPIQNPKHLGLPHQLPTPPTNNTTILLPTLTDKCPASPLYLIYIIFNIAFQQIYPAHYLPKNSESTVQPWIRA